MVNFFVADMIVKNNRKKNLHNKKCNPCCLKTQVSRLLNHYINSQITFKNRYILLYGSEPKFSNVQGWEVIIANIEAV